MGCNSSLPATTVQPIDQEKKVEQQNPQTTTAAKNDLPKITANPTRNNSLPQQTGNRKKNCSSKNSSNVASNVYCFN
jgi:hypothetical protein